MHLQNIAEVVQNFAKSGHTEPNQLVSPIETYYDTFR